MALQRTGKRKHQSASGAAMAGSGAVVAGTGLLAGGIPGAKPPKSFWDLRGSSMKEKRARPNALHNAKVASTWPRAGILGFRVQAHEDELGKLKAKHPESNYLSGLHRGKIEAEEKVLHGMKLGRKASYPVTIGGAALTAAGLHRKHASQNLKKRDSRQRGALVGTAGAVGGGAAGALGGFHAGTKAAYEIHQRPLRREYVAEHGHKVPKGMMVNDNNLARNSVRMARGMKAGVALGVPIVGTAGYRLARGKKVEKRDHRDTAAGALGTGATLAGVGHYVPKHLDKFGRTYEASSIGHIKAAQKLAPHFGGVHQHPAVMGPWDRIVKPAKDSMEPRHTDSHLRETGAADRIRGGANGQRAARVGYHRGIAAQEKHFAETFYSTGKGIRRARTPGLVLAAAGAGGLLTSQGKSKVKKGFGYERERVSPLRATEAAAGITLLGWGGSRLGLTKTTLAMGSRKAGNAGINFRRAEKARQAVEATTGRGAAMLSRSLNTGARLRPIEGAIAGGLLTNDAMPIRRKQFTPMRVQQGGY